MFDYLWSLWQAIHLGLRLRPDVVEIAQNAPNAGWIALGVVMVAGISLLLGQSVILFLNQIRPGRFAVSLLTNGLLLVFGWLFWSASVWIAGTWLFEQRHSFKVMLTLIGLSYAPLVFGFLILLPYLGPFVQRLLYTWSFLIALRAVAIIFEVNFFPALLCVGMGWLLLMLLTATIGRPIVALRDWLWQRLTGTRMDVSAQVLLDQIAIQNSVASVPPVTPAAPGPVDTKGDKA